MKEGERNTLGSPKKWINKQWINNKKYSVSEILNNDYPTY